MRTDPIIITGAGHSGTRGLVQVLTQTDNIYLGDIDNPKREWEFYRKLAAKVNARLLSLPEEHNHNLIPPEWYWHLRISEAQQNELTAYVTEQVSSRPDESMPPDDDCLWVIKTPRTVLCLEVWHSVFPEARFINLIRDGRDVAASLPSDAGSLLRRFELWRARVNRMWWYKTKVGLPIIDFRYEDLADPSKLRSLCDALGIIYTKRMQEQVVISHGKGIALMQGMPYEKAELLRHGYPVQPANLRGRLRGKLSRWFKPLRLRMNYIRLRHLSMRI